MNVSLIDNKLWESVHFVNFVACGICYFIFEIRSLIAAYCEIRYNIPDRRLDSDNPVSNRHNIDFHVPKQLESSEKIAKTPKYPAGRSA